MLRIGITGCFGSGKSTALDYFKNEGFPVINLDRIVSRLYKDEKIKVRIKKEFGTTNKKQLSGIVFTNSAKKRKLELILHAPALKEMNLRIKKLKQKMTKPKQKKKQIVLKNQIVFVEVPLLFEAKLEKQFDFVVTVQLSKKMCVNRLLKNGFSKKEILERLNSQMTISKKAKKADFVINNSKNRNTLRTQIKKICSELIKQC